MIMDFIRPRLKLILASALIITGIVYWNNRQEERYQQAVAVNQEVLKNLNVLQNRLHMNEQNALAFQEKLKQVENGRIQPVTNYYVAAPTVQAAADKVQEQIKNKDPALPPAALANTDRTAVVPNLEKQKVDVYKINLDKRWEFGVGVGYHNEWYVPVSLQKNIGRNRGIEGEIHVEPGSFNITGWEVKTNFRF